MRKCLLFLLAVLLAAVTVTAHAEGSQTAEPQSLEQLILQQHLTQKELERNLSLIKTEEKKLLTEVAQLDLKLQKQKLVMEAMKRHAGEVARAYYTGERDSFLSLLFDSENFNQFLLLFDFLQLLYQRDMNQLEKYQAERAKMTTFQSDKQQRLATITDLRSKFEKQLAEMLALQAEKEKNVQKLSDPSSVKSLMDHLTIDWRDRGLPAFRTFFEVLSKVMFQIPELATPERITSESLFAHTLTINQDDFNKFLVEKNDLFKQSLFTFDNNQLIVEGTYNQMNLKIVGAYQLVSPKELKFRITQLYFDGFLLPQTTMDEMEKKYDLSFYPSLISPNIEVEGITLAHKELKLQLKLDLPFGFGK